MTDACEMIARHLCTMAAQGWSGISAFERAAYRTTAAGMVEVIHASGFRILGPDEIDGPTLEKCAEICEQPHTLSDGTVFVLPSGRAYAAAIRAALQEGKE